MFGQRRRRWAIPGGLALALAAAGLSFLPGAAGSRGKTFFWNTTNSPPLSFMVSEPEFNPPQTPIPPEPYICRSSTSGSATVSVASSGGTAASGTDYTANFSTTVTFPRGRACMGIDLGLLDDENAGSESNTGNVTIDSTLSNPSKGWAIAGPTTETFTVAEEGAAGSGASLSAVKGSPGITLTWTNQGDGVDGWNILRSTSSGGETLLTTQSPNPVNNTTFTYTDTTTTAGTTYFYEVQSENDDLTGFGTTSNESSAMAG